MPGCIVLMAFLSGLTVWTMGYPIAGLAFFIVGACMLFNRGIPGT